MFQWKAGVESYRAQRLRGSPICRIGAVSLGGDVISPPIGKALAFHALQDDAGAFRVIL